MDGTRREAASRNPSAVGGALYALKGSANEAADKERGPAGLQGGLRVRVVLGLETKRLPTSGGASAVPHLACRCGAGPGADSAPKLVCICA